MVGTSYTAAGKSRMREEMVESGTMDSIGFGVAENTEGIQKPLKTQGLVFGREIFRNRRLNFEPNLNIATPENYVLGSGDEVIIDLWGNTVRNIRQEITPDGNITIDETGPIYLNGLKIEEAYVRVKNALSNVYASLKDDEPNTFMKLSLGKVRSIRVNVMGEVALPGTYTLPSLATLFHALYHAGGVGNIGSLRSIKVNRKGKEIADVDIYDYLLKGKSDLDISLNDGDVIIVPPYENMVTLKGNVKRPMIYELKGTETLDDLLKYAGIITYGLAHVTDAAKNPELLLALRGVNSNSEVPLYLRGQFTNASAFTSGKIYRVLYSFTDGDFDEPERCVELNVDVADWTVVPVSPEF